MISIVLRIKVRNVDRIVVRISDPRWIASGAHLKTVAISTSPRYQFTACTAYISFAYHFQMRFLDNSGGSKIPSKSVLDVGVKDALNASGFDEQMFYKRGGKYAWSKGDMKLTW